MAAINQRITNLVAGDAWKIQRTYTDLPSGMVFTKAYLTIKNRESDADPGFHQAEVTVIPSGDGELTEANSPTPSMYFTITAAKSVTAKPEAEMPYDVVLITDDGLPYTAEIGVLIPLRGVSTVNS